MEVGGGENRGHVNTRATSDEEDENEEEDDDPIKRRSNRSRKTNVSRAKVSDQIMTKKLLSKQVTQQKAGKKLKTRG